MEDLHRLGFSETVAGLFGASCVSSRAVLDSGCNTKVATQLRMNREFAVKKLILLRDAQHS